MNSSTSFFTIGPEHEEDVKTIATKTALLIRGESKYYHDKR